MRRLKSKIELMAAGFVYEEGDDARGSDYLVSSDRTLQISDPCPLLGMNETEVKYMLENGWAWLYSKFMNEEYSSIWVE